MTTDRVQPASVRLPRVAVVAAYAAGSALLAATAPLLAYAGSLALFGVPHALAELRYVDGRFSGRLRASRGGLVLAILATVVVLRSLGLAGVVSPRDGYVVELGLVAVLAFVVVPDLAASPGRALLAVGVGAAVATGSFVAPWATVAVLAILHNATPVGFLAERLQGTPRMRPAMLTCAALFLVVPALIATGAPARLLEAAGFPGSDGAFPSATPLAAHLRVFVPPGLLDLWIAVPLFSASAYLQLLHYGIVLAVLPRLLEGRGTPSDAPVVPWPKGAVVAAVIATVGIAAAMLFLRDFPGARSAYGLLASVHAWIEIPALLLALRR